MTIDSGSTHQEWMNFAFIVTGSIFLHSYWVLDNLHRYFLIRLKFEVLNLSLSYRIWNFPMYCAMTGSYFLDWHLFCEILHLLNLIGLLASLFNPTQFLSVFVSFSHFSCLLIVSHCWLTFMVACGPIHSAYICGHSNHI